MSEIVPRKLGKCHCGSPKYCVDKHLRISLFFLSVGYSNKYNMKQVKSYHDASNLCRSLSEIF